MVTARPISRGSLGGDSPFTPPRSSTGWWHYTDQTGLGTWYGYTDGDAYPVLTGDWNGDGKTDIARVFGDGVAFYVMTPDQGAWVQSAVLTGGNSLGPNAGYGNATIYPIFTGDWNGDGRTDIARITGPGATFYGPVNSDGTSTPDVITSVARDGQTLVQVTYAPLTQGGSLYAKDSTASYPQMDLQVALHVVSSSAASDGGGGTVSTTYAYGGASQDLMGRGFSGFRWLESRDSTSGLKVRTECRQDWPYAGSPSLVKKTQSAGAMLVQIANTFGCTDPSNGAACSVAAGNRYFPHLLQSVETGNDLNGTALPRVTTSTQYDGFGNATSVSTTTGDGFTKTTSNTFTNDTSNWILGRLIRGTVQSTTP